MFVIVQVKKFTENYMVSLNMNFPGFWVNFKKNQIIHQSHTTYQYIIYRTNVHERIILIYENPQN